MREDAHADVPLLLMCAEDNEVSLVHLVDVLNRSGRAPEVISGVEHDATLLSSATDRTRGAALFVLCQSDELDRTQVLRLSGLFSARKGPLHELLVVDVDGSASLDALPLIEAAMEAVSRGSSASVEASAARASHVPKRDVIVMPGDSAGSRAIPNFDEEPGGERQLRLDPETPQAPVTAEDEDEDEDDAVDPPESAGLAAAEQEAREAAEGLAREAAEQEAREVAEQAAREAAEQAAREAAEQAAREASERQAREAAEQAALEAAEQAAREAAEQEAREAAEQQVRDDAEDLARAFHEEMVAAEAVLERRSSRRSGPRPAPTGTGEPRRPLGDGVPVPLEPDQAETRPLGPDTPVAIPVPELPDPVEPPGDDREIAASQRDPDSSEELGPLSTSLSGVRVADPLASVPIPDAIQTELTPTDTRRRRREPEQTDTHSAARSHEARESRGGWLLAIAGAAALGGLALFVMNGGSTDDAGQRSASVASTPSGGSRATASAGGGSGSSAEAKGKRPVSAGPVTKAGLAVKPATEVKPEAEVRPASEVKPDAEVKPAPEAKPDAEVKPAPEAKPAAEAKPQAAVKPVPAVDPESKPVPEDVPTPPAVVSTVPPAPTDSEALRVDLAIRSGKIRALDSLLAARPGTEEVDWAEAKAVCRRKRVGGLPGWRLPSRRQLNRLRRSRLIRSGTYWSRERGSHDDDAFAVDAESSETHLYLVVEPAARVQCVRKR